MSIGLLLAAWSGSTIFGHLMGALNIAFDVEETRPYWLQVAIRLGTFLGGAVIVILASLVFLGGDRVIRWVTSVAGLSPQVAGVWSALQYPVAFAALVGLAFLIYWALPNTRPKKSHLIVGAVAATLLWIVATLLFRVYILNFPPNPAYGIIGGVIVLLGWMYYTMFVVLLGGELAAELNRGTGAMAPVVGAIYLGRVVSDRGPIPSTHRIEGRDPV
jgi:membrane protein